MMKTRRRKRRISTQKERRRKDRSHKGEEQLSNPNANNNKTHKGISLFFISVVSGKIISLILDILLMCKFVSGLQNDN